MFYLVNMKKVKLELVMSVHVDNLFMASIMETINNIKEKIK